MEVGTVLAGIGAGSGALNAINGSSGYTNAHSASNSNGFSDESSWSYGASASNAYSNMNSWSQGDSVDDSWGKSWNESENSSWGYSDNYGYSNSDAYNENYGRTYGREASAQDILNAAEANAIQRDLWSMQADYNAKEAQLSREWSKQMQDTYYQRLVKDLKSAGLNPILALSGYGASAPVGATATTGLASASKANAYAESTSGGYGWSKGRSENYGHSESGSYGWSKGGSESGSHGESHNRSEAIEQSRSTSSSHNEGGSTGHSENNSKSSSRQYGETTNNLKELGQSAKGIVKSAIGALGEYYNASKYRSIGSHSF